MKYPNGVTLDELFKNPLLKVNIAPVEYLLKSDKDWKPVDRLHELWKDSGLYKIITEEDETVENTDNCGKAVRCA